jgi:hypothetical protein
MHDPRYPIGAFEAPASLDTAGRQRLIDEIAATPARLRAAAAGLDDAQLDTPYRDGGWSVRQVIHHVPDSHLNAYLRLKLALTEEPPAIKTYDEAAWAALADSRETPVEVSLMLLEQLHARWVVLLRTLHEDDFARTFRHPERGLVDLDWLLAMYAWHGRHHTAHITSLRERMGW